ncbi:YceK/YidQ family lipoprotein [Stutzerimonas kunmingensis]|uniref:YceK/YidQ family lipoprotein n=1 Tax=Stutzerimonas kunmingensis TaxID=1211807 RepID=UPI0028A8F7ED|nr:YceK/YidQ family lipoprotein [Stutzerimonas kunmingensis]
MKLRCYFLSTLVSFMALLAGCGTLIGRNNGQPDIYPGLKQDAAFLGLGDVSAPYNPSGAATFICYTTIICVPLTLLSVPFDIAIDTLSLPIDWSETSKSIADDR